MKTTKIPAIRMEQRDTVIYLASVPVQIMLERMQVDRWDSKIAERIHYDYVMEQGYQREAMRTHFQKFSTYIQKDKSVLPTSILVNARTALNFIPDRANNGVGYLDISDLMELWVVDGQHRLRGFKHAIDEHGRDELKEFPIPVIIIDGMEKIEEMDQFRRINTEQKGVRTDLADNLLRILVEAKPELAKDIPGSQKWRLRATKLTEMMNNYDRPSPWKGRIRQPNDPPGNTILSTRSFSTSLKPIIQDGTMTVLKDNDIVHWLTGFWTVVEELMPEAFENPADYAVQKTPGTYTYHMIVPNVYALYVANGIRGIEGIREILSDPNVGEYFADSEKWRSGTGELAHTVGMGGFTRLAQDIRESLPAPAALTINAMV